MANEPVVTIVGNLVADPELRFTPSGVAVCNFRLASTPRVKNGDVWEDGETLWVSVSCWRLLAENVTESLVKGSRVIVQGRLSIRSWEGRDGKAGTSLELNADSVGAELTNASVTVHKVQRGDGARGSSNVAQAGDPWATAGAGATPSF